LLLQQLLQILTAPPQSNPIPSNQRREEKKNRIQRRIQEQRKRLQHSANNKRVKFRNPIFVASYLAASGEGNGDDLTIGIGDIPLAGEKHLSVAVNASMAAGWGLSCATNGEKRWRTKRGCDCVFLCLFIVFISSFCGAVKSISEDSSEIEHRRTAASSGVFFGCLACFLPFL
jgi:hypothetical protein